MPLLFKSKKSKVIKRQSGGDIPFYAQVQVENAKIPVANPAALLKLYSSSTPSESTKTKSNSAKSSDDKIAETPKGKNNEVRRYLDYQSELTKTLEDGIMSMGDEFLKTDLGMKVANELKYSAAQAKVELANNYDNWLNSKKQALEINKAGSDFVFNGSQFMAQDAKTGVIGWVDPSVVDEVDEETKTPKYKKIDYSEAFNKVNDVDDDVFMSKHGNELTGFLAQGISSDEVLKKTDDVYKNIGLQKVGHDVINKDGKVVANQKIFSETVTEESESQNTEELNNALEEVYSHLSQADRNSLLAKAWFTPSKFKEADGKEGYRKPKTHKEAAAVVDELLFKQMAKHYQYSFKDKTKLADSSLPTKDGANGGGGDDAPMARVSPFIMEVKAASTTVTDIDGREIKNPNTLKPTDEDIEKSLADEKNKNVTMFYPLRSAENHTIELQKVAKKITETKDREPVDGDAITFKELASSGSIFSANFNGAILENGKPLSTLKEGSNWLDEIFVPPAAPVEIAYLPVSVNTGKLWDPDGKSVEKHTKVMQDLKKNIEKNPALSNNPAEINKRLKEEQAKYYESLNTKDVRFQAFYVVKGAINYDSWPDDVQNIRDKEVTGGHTLTIDKSKLSTMLGNDWVFLPFLENKAVFNVLIKVPEDKTLQTMTSESGLGIYTEKNNLRVDNLNESQLEQERPITTKNPNDL